MARSGKSRSKTGVKKGGAHGSAADEAESTRSDGKGGPRPLDPVVETSERKRSEREPTEANVRFREVFENAPTGLALADLNGTVFDVNSALCAIRNTPREQLVGRTFAEASHPDDLEPGRERLARMVEGKSDSYRVERRFVSPAGDTIWTLSSVSLIRDDAGEPLYFIIQIQDTSEQKRSERELAEANERFREVFENAPTGIALMGLDGSILDVNPTLCSISGLSREQLLGTSFADSSHPDDLEPGLERLNDLIEGKIGSYQVERRFVHADGHYFGTLCSVSLVRGRKGKPLYFVAQIEDSSKREEAEQALVESNRRFVGAFENAPIGMALTRKDGELIQVNPALCEILGYERGELLKKKLRDLTHPDDVEESTLRLARLRAGEENDVRLEKRYLHADGHTVWVALAASEIRDDEGQPLYSIVQIQDISERKRSEQALAEANQRFVSAFENAPIGMAIVDTGGNYLEGNPTLRWMLGYPRERLLEIDFQTITHPDDRAAGAEYMREQLASVAPPFTFEKRYFHADGHEVWTRILSSLVRDEQGEPLYFVTQIEDISERKQMEEEIRRASTVLEEAQQLASVGGWEWNVRESRLFLSPALRRIAGIADGELPSPETVKTHMRSEEMEQLVPQVERAIERGEPFRFEFRYVLPDGRERTMNLRAVVEPDDEGNPLRVIGVVQDVTERVEAEAARLQLEEQMQEAQRLESLGVLAGGIAHDFNNLLVGVLGNASLAMTELPADSPAKLLIDQIDIAARRAAELTKQMLAYSGRGQFVVRLLDMREVVRETAVLLESAISKNVRMNYDFAEDVPAVRADVAQVRQLIMNLITNASDAIGEGSGEISVRIDARAMSSAELAGYSLSEGLTESTYVSIEVADNGSGMDAETSGKIFDPFFTTKFSGHGLGLAAALGIVRGHHGAIKVWSEPGKGSRFSLLFPAVEETAATVQTTTADVSWEGSGTVMIVDDEEIVRRAARRILSTGGIEVVEASSGKEALEIFREEPGVYKLALVDLVMPGMSGVELVKALRALRPDLPVVFSSGYDARALAESASSDAKTSFLQKPYSARDMLNSVRNALSGN
jgi:two-component system cell cycle sensor histidine kinase/response regulator CckA